MSETVIHSGRLIELPKLKDKELKEIVEIIKYLDPKADIDIEDDELDSDVIFRYNLRYYELKEHKYYDAGEYICDHNVNEDNSIDFFTSFYNGGTCLLECVEDILKEVNKDE